MTGRGRRPPDGPSRRGCVLLSRSVRSPGVPVIALLSAALWSLARSLTIVAFSWTVVSSVQSAFAVPLLFAVRALPGVIFGLFAGPAVDRLGSRPSVMRADSVSAACLIALITISADGKLTFRFTSSSVCDARCDGHHASSGDSVADSRFSARRACRKRARRDEPGDVAHYDRRRSFRRRFDGSPGSCGSTRGHGGLSVGEPRERVEVTKSAGSDAIWIRSRGPCEEPFEVYARRVPTART